MRLEWRGGEYALCECQSVNRTESGSPKVEVVVALSTKKSVDSLYKKPPWLETGRKSPWREWKMKQEKAPG